jgi:uncharacterized membrane protein
MKPVTKTILKSLIALSLLISMIILMFYSNNTYTITSNGLVRNYNEKMMMTAIPLSAALMLFIIYRFLNKKKDDKENPVNEIDRQINTENNKITDFSAQLVEVIIKNLQINPPGKQLCWVVLFGDRPLTANLEGECILMFWHKSKVGAVYGSLPEKLLLHQTTHITCCRVN